MRFLFVFVIALITLTPVFGQNDDCHRSTEGTDFWFGFMESRWYHENSHYLEITVTAREATSFIISIGPNEVLFNNGNPLHLLDNESRQIRIPWEQVEAIGSEIIQDKGIHLVSEKPVNVYALNFDNNSADVAVIYPKESLGYEYFAMCYSPHIHESNGYYGNGRNSEFLIVASEDSTTVNITPSVVTDGLKPANSIFSVLLNKGQVYQVQSMNFNNLAGQGDLTGSYVNSNKPIAFFSGSLATTIPATSSTSAWDHLYEQIPPIQTWGKEYYVVPLRSREQDLYRVMAARDSTTITIEGNSPVTLNRGEFYEFILYHNQPSKISADKPILVVQFSQSQSVDFIYTGRDGDPFMIVLSPTSQSKNDVTFVAYDSNQIKKYFVNIITLTEETQNIVFDNHPITNSFTPFSDGIYSYAQIEIDPREYRIYNKNPDRGFLAYVYGFGGVESYGYGVGFNLNLVLDIKESIDFDGDTLLLCHGDSRTLDAGPYFDNYQWNTGDSTQKLLVYEEGKYSITASTIDGCILHDSIFITVSHPTTNIGPDTAFCYPETIQLDATNSGLHVYQWQTGDSTSVITADKTDMYHVTVFDYHGCRARDTMFLEVYPLPTLEIVADKLICGDTVAELKVNISGVEDNIWSDGSFIWSVDKPGSLTFSNMSHTEADIKVSEWGEYIIGYELTTIDGCVVIDTFTIQLYPNPTSEFTFIEDPYDKCSGYTRQVLFIGDATENGNFYWDFGGSQMIDSLGWQNFTVSVGTFQSNPFISLYVEENGCWSNTSSDTIGANPDFQLLTEKSRGCDSTTINFIGDLKKVDALRFEWDFGDGSPVSNDQSVSHFYSEAGFYDVGLTITNYLTQCKLSFTIDSMVKIFTTPEALFSADPEYCYPDSFEVEYLNVIDSSICYWSFEDCHQTGGSNHIVQGIIDQPTGYISLVVDEFGCVSDSVKMKVKRNPHFDFYTDFAEGCQPYTFELIADPPSNDSLDFTWILDSLPHPEGNSFVQTLSEYGKYGFELQGISSITGCASTVTKNDWITVHPKPLSNFYVDYEIATVKHPTIQFTDSSIYGVNYYWDFDDDEFSEFQNPSHEYLEIGEYYPQLITETEFGCLDTSVMLIQILAFDVFTPNAFRPDSEIEENREFMPLGVGADPNRFHIQIFDRWGQIVFESKSFDNKWDGKMRNGDNAPMGNYIWISNFFDVQGYEHSQKGQVILVR